MHADDRRAFYLAAHLGLRALDARGARRRFGAIADARWKQFRGDLTDADRLDLLVRDAAAQYPLAFAPREVFALPDLAEDDPFGPAWEGPPFGLAGEILRSELASLPSVREDFDAAARAWGVLPASVTPDSLPRITPTSRLVVAGLGALRTLVAVFAEDRARLDLAEQLVYVARLPSERQLLGLSSVFLGTEKSPRCVAPAQRDLVRVAFDAVVVSEDADPEARDAAKDLGARTR